MFIKIGTTYFNPNLVKSIKVREDKIIAWYGEYFNSDYDESEDIYEILFKFNPEEIDAQVALDNFMLKLEKQIIAQEKFLRSLDT